MPELASSAAVAALFLALALGAVANLLASHYRAYGILAGACAVRGIAYTMRAAYAPESPASMTLAWWAMTTAGLGLAVCANGAVLVSWLRNARAASKPPNAKTWGEASKALMLAATVAGPALAVASAGLAHGARLEETLAIAARVKEASVWGTLAVAALAALQIAGATCTCILGICAGPQATAAVPKPRAGPYSSGGGIGSSSGGGAVRSSGGGSSRSSRLSISHHDPERGMAEPIDLGQPIAIIATVEEEEEEDTLAAAGAAAVGAAAHEAADSAGGAAEVLANGAGSSSGGGGAAESKAPPLQLQPVVTIPLPPPLDVRADRWVALLLACSGLLVMSAAVRGVALGSAALWASDRLLLLLVALPELLSAVLLVGPPKMMARVAMASRYARWQPQKGKPPTSRPKNSNPAIWRRAGQPAPASRTHTYSESGM